MNLENLLTNLISYRPSTISLFSSSFSSPKSDFIIVNDEDKNKNEDENEDENRDIVDGRYEIKVVNKFSK